MGNGGKSLYGEVLGDGSTKEEFLEPGVAFSFCQRVESASYSDDLGAVVARRTFSRENVYNAVIEVTISMTWQEDVTSRRSKYARTGFPRYVTVHRKRRGNEAEGCTNV